METVNGFISTGDKIKIAYEHTRRGFGELIIICPGFFNSKKNRWMRITEKILADRYDTLVFDFRGHGESSGWFSWSAKEHYDVEAVLGYARQFNYSSIGIIAYSLGAAALINTVSRVNDGVSSMILISCPYSFWQINYHFWEKEMFSDFKDNMECRWEGKGARCGNLFLFKPKPINEIKKIKDISVFFIHGTKDWLIKEHHSRKLYKAAVCRKRIEVIDGGLHAERLIQQHPQKMKELILDWFKETIANGK